MGPDLLAGMRDRDPRRRAATAVRLGHTPTRGGVDALRRALETDSDARVRAAAVGALVRRTRPARAAVAWTLAAHDRDAMVRRRAAETAPRLGAAVPIDELAALLCDADPLVAEAAAFALGERPDVTTAAVRLLAEQATGHGDPLVREAAVAALGALGHPLGRAAVLAACTDKPAIRRRAVLALAAFAGPDIEAAIRRARDDRDWQVRDAAALLLDE